MTTFLTPQQVAERWACSRRHVQRLCASGALAAMRIGSDWRISLAAVEDFETRHANDPGPAPAPTPRDVTRPTAVAGFTLPADYSPVFGDLWPFHETRKSARRR